jgi:predicted  nucleic acid-binding Zn-ribbon protein
MKEAPPPSTFDQATILSGMTGSGKFRSVFVSGPSNQAKAKKLAELGTAIVRTEPTTFCSLIDSRKTQTPYEWCSQFARTLRTMSGAEPMALAKFAMGVGRSLIPFKPGGSESSPENEANEKVVAALVDEFESLTEHLPKGNQSPKLVIIMDKCESLDSALLEWMSTVLNQAFRDSSSFNACRFIFSAQQKSKEISDFFSRFGFEHVHEFILGGLANPSDANSAEQRKAVEADPVAVSPVSLENADHTNELNSSTTATSLKDEHGTLMGDKLSKAKEFFSGYDDIQKGYLFLAAYAGTVSRYSLEYFSDSRTAAQCYNWLKRQSDLSAALANGDISMREEVIEQARTLHAHERPEEAEKWSTLSSVLDAFFKQFPASDTHWIPVNLQQFTWFNDRLIGVLFDGDQYSAVSSFVNSHENAFAGDESRRSLTEEMKILTRRLVELSHLEPISGLVDKAREQWLVDSEKLSNKRIRLEDEKKNLAGDVAGSVQEISNLNTLKEKLVDEFKSPGSLSPERILSFSSSILLIVIGLGTVGLSLLSESLGTYHAACGLGLTLFGFFWPTVEFKRAAEATAIASSPLTIDAQQRSLEHRISNLNNRLKIMQGNLGDVESQLAKLDENVSEAYVEISE